jgi:hypothetical protein
VKIQYSFHGKVFFLYICRILAEKWFKQDAGARMSFGEKISKGSKDHHKVDNSLPTVNKKPTYRNLNVRQY